MPKFISKSISDTEKLAQKIAKDFKSGEILGLVGDLGSGKTHFTKGLAKYFKIKNPITSPTFVVMKIYNIKNKEINKLIHIDVYRLSNSEELLDLGLQDLIQDKKNIIVIEWADKIKNVLPKNTKWITFKLGKKDNEREITY